ncbi:MAG: sugar transferase [Acidimicrobiales bacterium]|nr:sugar transferase [Acidimicrobiales bacterium]
MTNNLERIDGTNPVDTADAAHTSGAPTAGSSWLRRSLRLLDAAALLISWAGALVVLGLPDDGRTAIIVPVALTAVGMGLLNHYGLYLARVATMRTVEHTLIVRVSGLLFAIGAVLQFLGSIDLGLGALVLGSVSSLMLLMIGRTVYRAWLAGARASGRFTQAVVIVGADDASLELRLNLDEQPELGYRVVGVIGDRPGAARNGLSDLWLGTVDEAEACIDASAATGAIISSTAFDTETVNTLTRNLLAAGCHVHVTTGITGVDQRRMRSVHVGYEPLVYVERLKDSRIENAAKKALDLGLAAVLTILTAPVVIVSAIAIKLEDRGPVLFRQDRVGRDGEIFRVLKLRTMSVDAEAALDDLRKLNERSGPLFKLHSDPRVTRVGGVLRALSIDELPQLWNVLRREMSLVGPRPALPSEAAAFTVRLQDRTRVLPGITGLWQVEARDNPSFRAYERLDLFYVDNWSIGLDLMILIATAESELSRVIRRVMGRSDEAVIDLRDESIDLRDESIERSSLDESTVDGRLRAGA